MVELQISTVGGKSQVVFHGTSEKNGTNEQLGDFWGYSLFDFKQNSGISCLLLAIPL